MKKNIEGKSYVLGVNIDTDQIIPAEHLVYSLTDPEESKKYGHYALSGVPPAEAGLPQGNLPFIEGERSDSDYSIIVGGPNFGCGSSREHAPQSLMRMGIRGIVGESFAEIFAGNCTALGIPTVCINEKEIEILLSQIETAPETEVLIDLEKKTVSAGQNSFSLTIPEPVRQSLTSGAWDTTAALLQNRDMVEKKAKELSYIAGY